VEEINAGAAPWLYQPSYGHKQFPEPLMVIPARVTLAEFVSLVARAGGSVFAAVPEPKPVMITDDETVEQVAQAIENAAIQWLGRDLGTLHRNDIARAALAAALSSEPHTEGEGDG
jgi:hypothetical protein